MINGKEGTGSCKYRANGTEDLTVQGKGAAVGHAETRPQDLEPGPKEEPREL